MIKKILLATFLMLFFVQLVQSQVLISLLFGDKLNTDKLRFGLEGGVNVSDVKNLETAKSTVNFNLGFYFDLLIKEETDWYVHTGVLVKSKMGASLDPYSLGDPDLDEIFENGDVDRKLHYFNVPILARYKFDDGLFIEAGPVLGWMLSKSNDKFSSETIDGDNIILERNISDDYHKIDLAFEAGIGYQLDILHGMVFGTRYYHSLMDISKDIPGDALFNTQIYIYAGIPIGAGEKAKAKNAAAKEKRALRKKEKEKNKLENN